VYNQGSGFRKEVDMSDSVMITGIALFWFAFGSFAIFDFFFPKKQKKHETGTRPTSSGNDWTKIGAYYGEGVQSPVYTGTIA
jgi:hypothetical protein